MTNDANKLTGCKHCLVYLNAKTWTRPKESDALAAVISQAMNEDVHILLVHEMVGLGGQTERGACEFDLFFSNDHGVRSEAQ